MTTRNILIAAVLLLLLPLGQVDGNAGIIITENGGGKELIENSLPAITLAATQNVDYLGLQVVMTADDELVVFRDLTLDRQTDVATLFPDRHREDGSYYVIDFTLREIRQLRMKNIVETTSPTLSFTIPTLQEALSLVRHLETLIRHQIGIVVEIRKPWFHRDEGKDISAATLDALSLFDYTAPKDKIYLQCFDPEELQRINGKLMPERQLQLPLIQLIGENDGQETKQRRLDIWEPYNYDWLYTNIGLRMIASYATAIGLPQTAIFNQDGDLILNDYIDGLHGLGLKALVYPKASEKKIAALSPDFSALLKRYAQAGIDGLYTDSFREINQFLKEREPENQDSSDPPAAFPSQDVSSPAALPMGTSGP
ncbi:MAG: glycerophosphodiester phosphodiesterase [Desulforhopalus sp.]